MITDYVGNEEDIVIPATIGEMVFDNGVEIIK